MAMSYDAALRIAAEAGTSEAEFREMLREGRVVSQDADGVVWFYGERV